MGNRTQSVIVASVAVWLIDRLWARDEFGPVISRSPNAVHEGKGVRFGDGASGFGVAVEECADTRIVYAMYVNICVRNSFYRFAKFGKILIFRGVELYRYVDVFHAKRCDAAGFIRKRTLIMVGPKVNDMRDAQPFDFSKLIFRWLARQRDPVIEPSPVYYTQ